MKKNLFRFIILIFTFIAFFFPAKSQHFAAKVDTAGVLCESTFNDVFFNIQQITPEQTLRLYGFRFVILYDHHHVTFDSISYVHGAFRDSLMYEAVEDTVFLQVNSIANPNPFDSGTLFKICFTGVERGLTQIGFVESDCYILAENETSVTMEFEPIKLLVYQGYIDAFLEQTNWGCSYENKGQAYISILDGIPPYQYEWKTSFIQRDTFAQGLSGGTQHVWVTDGNRCKYDQTIEIGVLPAPKFEWEMTPDPAVIEKLIKFNVTDPGDGMNWYWEIVKSGGQDTIRCDDDDVDLLSCNTSTEYIFYEAGEYIVKLSANNADACDTTIEKVITVLPIELEFKNVITPDRNRFKIQISGKEDIPLSDVFSEHELIVYNRVGKVVYKTTDFSHEGWDGDNLGDGTYYYVLKAETLKDKYYYRGNLVILGKQ
ncbi:MAG: gliding motility-associated C-terminal domain-containing protein [Bacteroidales bacterium]|nr:gliding motility-associated C-terminal domain-containing protein [Bacteroidales bacterium]